MRPWPVSRRKSLATRNLQRIGWPTSKGTLAVRNDFLMPCLLSKMWTLKGHDQSRHCDSTPWWPVAIRLMPLTIKHLSFKAMTLLKGESTTSNPYYFLRLTHRYRSMKSEIIKRGQASLTLSTRRIYRRRSKRPRSRWAPQKSFLTMLLSKRIWTGSSTTQAMLFLIKLRGRHRERLARKRQASRDTSTFRKSSRRKLWGTQWPATKSSCPSTSRSTSTRRTEDGVSARQRTQLWSLSPHKTSFKRTRKPQWEAVSNGSGTKYVTTRALVLATVERPTSFHWLEGRQLNCRRKMGWKSPFFQCSKSLWQWTPTSKQASQLKAVLTTA